MKKFREFLKENLNPTSIKDNEVVQLLELYNEMEASKFFVKTWIDKSKNFTVDAMNYIDLESFDEKYLEKELGFDLNSGDFPSRNYFKLEEGDPKKVAVREFVFDKSQELQKVVEKHLENIKRIKKVLSAMLKDIDFYDIETHINFMHALWNSRVAEKMKFTTDIGKGISESDFDIVEKFVSQNENLSEVDIEEFYSKINEMGFSNTPAIKDMIKGFYNKIEEKAKSRSRKIKDAEPISSNSKFDPLPNSVFGGRSGILGMEL